MVEPIAPRPARIRVSSTWPGPITLRRGWAKAVARPWNREFADAHLRIIRGGADFIRACADHLLAEGAPSVLSPPLPLSAQTAWTGAGFEHYLNLTLLRLDLDRAPPTPTHLVVEAGADHLSAAEAIDAAAFEPFWRLDRHGLEEAIQATSQSRFLMIRDPAGSPAGFAILGLGHALSYLQRVAVAPRWQRCGMGRSLVRACARRARAAGAGALLLNTQIDNEPALSLYASEGFVQVSDDLGLLRTA